MKIAFYAPYDFRAVGGAERFVLFFSHALALAGCEVSVFGRHLPKIEGVHCVDAFSGGFSQTFDVCFSQAIYGFGGLPKAGLYIHRYNGTSFGNMIARPYLFFHPRFWWWLYSELNSGKGKDGYIFVSKSAQDEMRMLGHRSCRNSIILPGGGGWEKERFSADKASNSSRHTEPLRLLFCGRIDDKVKRFSLIKNAFLQARQKFPQISLYVLGGEALKSRNDGIHYLGTLSDSDMLPILHSCQVQINASFYEGFSLALSEGIFKAGLITLATPVGGNLECLRHGQTGFFFASEHALAFHIMTLADDQPLREKMLKNVSQMAIRSWEEVCQEALKFASSLSNSLLLSTDKQ